MASLSMTYTFSNGSVADATQVNANLQKVVDGTSDGTIDFNIAALTCAGTATLNGNTNIGNASGDDLTITASLASSLALKTANTYDIGASAVGLASIYMASASNKTMRLLFTSGASNLTWTLPGTNGTKGHVLQNDGAGAWAYVPHQTANSAVASADYVVTDTDGYYYLAVTTGSSNRTITLPASATNSGRMLFITKADSGTGFVIVDGNGSEKVGDALVKRLVSQYDYIQIRCDGSNWQVMSMGSHTESHNRQQAGNGHGATSTKIRRFSSSIVSAGGAITYADDSNTAGTWTVNQDGIYSIHYTDVDNTAAAEATCGISLNSSQLTTNIQSITDADRIAIQDGATAGDMGFSVSATRRCAVGDVIRAHTDGGVENTSGRVAISVTLVRPC